jgi:hypothetical protein
VSFAIIAARFFVRKYKLKSRPVLSDWFVVLAWFLQLGWSICVLVSIPLGSTELDIDPSLRGSPSMLKVRLPLVEVKF